MQSISQVSCESSTIGDYLSQQIEQLNNGSGRNGELKKCAIIQSSSNHAVILEIELIEPPITITSSRLCHASINQTKWSMENVKIVRNCENHIFLLSRNELILLQEKNSPSHLIINEKLIAELGGLDSAINEIRVEQWINIFVIVVLTDRNLHIFHTEKAVNDIMTNDDTQLTKIETINLKNSFCQFELMRNGANGLYLVTYEIRNETTNDLM